MRTIFWLITKDWFGRNSFDKKRIGMHRSEPSTAGEELCHYIHEKLDDNRAWRYLQSSLQPVGNSEQLARYYRLHSSLFLTCKLISAGRSISTDGNMDALFSIVQGFPWNHLNAGNKLLRLLSNAVSKSDRDISPGVKSVVLAYAKQHHRHCYICGIGLDFDISVGDRKYSAEHLWPSSYGGDSQEDNLLPACSQCNSAKGNLINWVSSDVHALFLGINPEEDKLRKIQFKRRYALYHRAGLSLAIQRQTTLKKAFLKLGPWGETRVHDSEITADMFNLKTHNDIEELENYEAL